MAISPNTNFTSGQILTATQQNQFPRGIVAFGTSTTNISFGGETTIITTGSFTAVANRYYRIVFFQPTISNVAPGYAVMKIKNGATILNTSQPQQFAAGAGYQGSCEAVTTFTAGTVTITGTLQSTNVGATLNSSTQYGYLLVEDIGPA